MAHTDTRERLCRDCDGFPVVHVDSGTLNTDGTRRTLRVVCKTCHGTGVAPLRTRPAVEVHV